MSSPSGDRVSDSLLSHLSQFCEANPSPRTLGVWILVRGIRGELGTSPRSAAESLIDLPAPCDHGDHIRYASDRYASEFLKKAKWLPIADRRRENARLSFWAAETNCELTNARMRNEPKPPWFERVRKLVAEILGPLTSDRLDQIVDLAKHGPGASVGVPGDGAVVSDKYRYPVTLTEKLLPYAESLMGPLWFQNATLEVVANSEWSCVPKNARTDRGICKEPTLDMFLQLGIGRFLMKRLKRFGVDLQDQSWNQFLASVAQDWNLATLDLKAASDHLSYEVVRDLLPPNWFALFALCRTPLMKIRKEKVALQKWSTMGNGYTFPLETMIFLAVVLTTVPRRDWCVCAVYGDDIVVPQRSAREVIDRLEYLGFKVNTEKSCLAGNFFESCGADFLNGKNVRPFFAPTEPGPIPKSVQTANGFRTWTKSIYGYCPKSMEPLWSWLAMQAPSLWRSTCVPPSWGDVGIIRDEPLGEWLVADPERDGYGWEGYLAKSVIFVPREGDMADYQDIHVLLAGLRQIGVPDSPSGKGLEPRKGLYGRPVARYAFSPRWDAGWTWQ